MHPGGHRQEMSEIEWEGRQLAGRELLKSLGNSITEMWHNYLVPFVNGS